MVYFISNFCLNDTFIQPFHINFSDEYLERFNTSKNLNELFIFIQDELYFMKRHIATFYEFYEMNMIPFCLTTRELFLNLLNSDNVRNIQVFNKTLIQKYVYKNAIEYYIKNKFKELNVNDIHFYECFHFMLNNCIVKTKNDVNTQMFYFYDSYENFFSSKFIF